MTKEKKFKIANEVVRLKDEEGKGFYTIAEELGISVTTAHRYYTYITTGKVKTASDMPKSLRTPEHMEELAVEIEKLTDEGLTQREIADKMGLPRSTVCDLKMRYIDGKSINELVTDEVNKLVSGNPERVTKVEKLLSNNVGLVEVEISSDTNPDETISVEIDYPDISDQEEFLKEFGKRTFEKLRLRPVFPWTKISLEN